MIMSLLIIIKFNLNDFNDIIDDNSYNLFLNALSKKKDFILNIHDKDFNLMIENKYFKENPRFEIVKIKIPRLLLIKDNKLTNKAINTFKNIFNLSKSKYSCFFFIHFIIN